MQFNYSTGIDLVYMRRFLDKINNMNLIKKILTNKELEQFNCLNNERRKLEYFCGRFAAKEAYSKALKSGIGPVSFQDFEVLKDELGCPISNVENCSVSISHDGDYTIAIVIIGGE